MPEVHFKRWERLQQLIEHLSVNEGCLATSQVHDWTGMKTKEKEVSICNRTSEVRCRMRCPGWRAHPWRLRSCFCVLKPALKAASSSKQTTRRKTTVSLLASNSKKREKIMSAVASVLFLILHGGVGGPNMMHIIRSVPMILQCSSDCINHKFWRAGRTYWKKRKRKKKVFLTNSSPQCENPCPNNHSWE